MALRFEGVYKRFDDKQIMAGFSFAFPEQGSVALMGPSGCGKTTLLRLAAGLERPDRGRILPSHKDHKIAMLFQEDRLLPTLTALENVTAPLRGNQEADITRGKECLERCGLADELHRYPDELSGGMRRRVAIARAVAYDGDILLLDEPFRGLDDRLRLDIMKFVLEIAADRLVIMVTHDRSEAASADRIVHLSGPPLLANMTGDDPMESRG